MKLITSCRACGSKALTPAFNIGRGAHSAARRKSGDVSEYVLCDPSRHARACGLLQHAHEDIAAPSAPSARHASNRDHLRAVATEALELISGRDSAALDIGCNDGSLLSYYPRWVERFGVDPGKFVEDVGPWAKTLKEEFPTRNIQPVFGKRHFDIITAVSVLEYIDDPRALLSAVRDYLAGDGVFILETLYAPMVLTRNCVDVFQTGAAAVYSLATLEWLIRAEGMKVFKGALTTKNGGSVRLFVTHAENEEFDFEPWSTRLARLWDEENALAMRALQPYQTFEQRAAAVREEFCSTLNNIAQKGERVFALGADPETRELLDWAGESAKVVSAVVDTNAARHENSFGAAALPIISESEARTEEPDYFLTPARYKREMLERWRESIMLGGKIILATPAPHIVTAHNYAGEYGKTLEGGEGAGGAETLRAILAAAGGPRLIAENGEKAKVG